MPLNVVLTVLPRQMNRAGREGALELEGDPAATPADLDALAQEDEEIWLQEREAYLLYR